VADGEFGGGVELRGVQRDVRLDRKSVV